MQKGLRKRLLAWAWLSLSTSLAAQTTPFPPPAPGDPLGGPFPLDPRQLIAVDPLDPDFDPNDPRYRVLLPEELREPRPPTPVVTTALGEAFSVRENEAAIELTFGEEPALGETLGVRIHRLAVEPAVVELAVGESFALDQLVVRAYGTTGEFVEHVPIRLELEGPEGFVDLAVFEADGRTLQPLTRGIGRLWVTSMLPALITENFSLPVVLIVREPGARRTRLSPRRYENVPAAPPRR